MATAPACRLSPSFLSALSSKGAAKPIGIPLGHAYNFGRTADGGGDAERTLIMPPWKSFGVDSRDGGLWYRPRMYCTEWFD